MRIDKNNPRKEYVDFWDWLYRRENIAFIAFILALAVGYHIYLADTWEA